MNINEIVESTYARELRWLQAIKAVDAKYYGHHWQASNIIRRQHHLEMPDSMRFTSVNTFVYYVDGLPAKCLPTTCGRLRAAISSGTFTPSILGSAEISVINNANIDMSQLQNTADKIYVVLKDSNNLSSSIFRNYQRLTFGDEGDKDIELDGDSLNVDPKGKVVIDAMNVRSLLNVKTEYISCYYGGDPLDLANPLVSPDSTFIQDYDEVAQPFYGSGDVLGMQDALLDAGYI